MTGWLIVAAVFAGVAFAFALAQMAHITPDDDSTCPEPDDVAKFASIVRHFDDGSVALEGLARVEGQRTMSHEMPCDDCGTSIPILFARIVGARPVRLVCRICAQRWLEGRRFKGLS